jgi:hypothetical protein
LTRSMPENARITLPSGADAQARRPNAYTLPYRLLLCAGALMVWGPPRFQIRDLSAALDSPLQLDPIALLRVGTWVVPGILILYFLQDHIQHRTNWLSQFLSHPPIRWYLLFGILGLASVLYSVSHLYTLFFAAKLVIGVLAFGLIIEHDPKAAPDRALRLFFAVYVAQAAAIVLLLLVKPELVFEGGEVGGGLFASRLTGGVFEDYGTSALFAGLWLLTVALFGRSKIKRVAALAGYAATWILMLASQTRSTIAAGLLFFVVMMSLRPSSRDRMVLIVLAGSSLALSVLTRQAEAVWEVATRSGDGLATLTGRTVAFDFLIERWRESPIYGFGYGAGTRSALITFIEQTGLLIGAGHDVLSTVLVDLGLLGAFVLGVAFVSAWRQVIRLVLRAPKLQNHRIVVAHLTCMALWVTLYCFVGQSLAAPFVPFMVLITTTWVVTSRLPPRGAGERANGLARTASRRVMASSVTTGRED